MTGAWASIAAKLNGVGQFLSDPVEVSLTAAE
jgi:hypothetical protein